MTHREVANRVLMLMKPESLGVISGTDQWNAEEMLESRRTKDQLVIDRATLSDCKQRKTNLAITWISGIPAGFLIPFVISNATSQQCTERISSWLPTQ